MNVHKCTAEDADSVLTMTHETILAVYPRYYPEGAVRFFLDHHSPERIRADIEAGCVFLLEDGGVPVGTVTVNDAEINRLFVPPRFQHRGYGKSLIDFAEDVVAASFDHSCLSSSLPAKHIYLKRGYKEVSSHSILTDNGNLLCYDFMEKPLSRRDGRISYNGKTFVPYNNTENGEVSDQTVFHYHQDGMTLFGEYSGGTIVRGSLMGIVAEDATLDFYYQHVNRAGDVKTGKCHSIPRVLEDGKLEMSETWQWLNGDGASGASILREV